METPTKNLLCAVGVSILDEHLRFYLIRWSPTNSYGVCPSIQISIFENRVISCRDVWCTWSTVYLEIVKFDLLSTNFKFSKTNQKCDNKSLIGNLVSLTCEFQKRMLLVDGSWKLLCCAPSTAGNAADSFFWYKRFVSKGSFVPEQVSGYDITSGASPARTSKQSRAGVGAPRGTGAQQTCRVELDQQHLNKEKVIKREEKGPTVRRTRQDRK